MEWETRASRMRERLMICRGDCGHWQEWEGIRTFMSHYGGQA